MYILCINLAIDAKACVSFPFLVGLKSKGISSEFTWIHRLIGPLVVISNNDSPLGLSTSMRFIG